MGVGIEDLREAMGGSCCDQPRRRVITTDCWVCDICHEEIEAAEMFARLRRRVESAERAFIGIDEVRSFPRFELLEKSWRGPDSPLYRRCKLMAHIAKAQSLELRVNADYHAFIVRAIRDTFSDFELTLVAERSIAYPDNITVAMETRKETPAQSMKLIEDCAYAIPSMIYSVLYDYLDSGARVFAESIVVIHRWDTDESLARRIKFKLQLRAENER